MHYHNIVIADDSFVILVCVFEQLNPLISTRCFIVYIASQFTTHVLQLSLETLAQTYHSTRSPMPVLIASSLSDTWGVIFSNHGSSRKASRCGLSQRLLVQGCLSLQKRTKKWIIFPLSAEQSKLFSVYYFHSIEPLMSSIALSVGH